MKELIERIIKEQLTLSVDKAKVISVNETHCEVQSLSNDKTFFKCSLNAVLDNDVNEVKITPEVNSVVVIAVFDRSAAIIQTSKVKSFSYRYKDNFFELTENGLELTRSGKNLKEAINELQDEITKLCDALSAVVVSPGYGVTPNVGTINSIKAKITENKNTINQLLK